MAMRKPVTINGKTFPSQKDALEYYNVSRATVHNRLKKGMSIDEAYTNESKTSPPQEVTIGNTSYPSIRQACIHLNKSTGTVKSRIAKGATPEEALTMPDSYFYKKRENKTIFRGKEYRTEKDACIEYNVNPKTVNVYKHRHELNFEDALNHFINQKGKE